MSEPTKRPRVVVLGGGFGGLYAARALATAPVELTLVDRRNHHLFQPLLYQVATAGLSAPDIAAPIRQILRDQQNATVLMDEVLAVDPGARTVQLSGGPLPYDHLVVATGTESSYFGNDAWEEHAPGLKSLEDAFAIRARILSAFEEAERETDPARRAAWLTFVVIGAGPTGVELAGAIREIAVKTLTRDFRRFDASAAQVMLVEGGERVLAAFPEALSKSASEQLEARGVRIRTGSLVTHVDAAGLAIGEERLEARTVLWAAGVRGSALATSLGAELTRDGRVLVTPDLSVPGRPEIQVVGDLAAVPWESSWVPGMAPGAIQEGRHAARNIRRALAGEPALPFEYRHKGLLATIGRSAAVAEIGRWRLSGFLAWCLWLFVHVFWLIGFRNRLVVMLEWAWAYFTYQRSARVILNRPRGLSRSAGADPQGAADSSR